FFVFSLFRAFVIVFFSSGAFVISFFGTRLANSLHDGPTSSFAARGRADAGSSESEDPANGQSTWTAGYLLRRPTLFYCHSLSARGLSGPRRRALVSSGPDYGCAGRRMGNAQATPLEAIDPHGCSGRESVPLRSKIAGF